MTCRTSIRCWHRWRTMAVPPRTQALLAGSPRAGRRQRGELPGHRPARVRSRQPVRHRRVRGRVRRSAERHHPTGGQRPADPGRPARRRQLLGRGGRLPLQVGHGSRRAEQHHRRDRRRRALDRAPRSRRPSTISAPESPTTSRRSRTTRRAPPPARFCSSRPRPVHPSSPTSTSTRSPTRPPRSTSRSIRRGTIRATSSTTARTRTTETRSGPSTSDRRPDPSR